MLGIGTDDSDSDTASGTCSEVADGSSTLVKGKQRRGRVPN